MLAKSPPPAGLKRPDEWFTPLRFAGILAVLIFASFPEVILGRGTFFHRDFALFGYPLAYYHREAFWRGEIPFWNPLSCCGLPFLAQWNTLTLYPLSLIYLLLPLNYSLGLFCLAHLFLAGMGMYFLAYAWTQNRFAASVSGTAFVFSSLMLNYLMWPNNMAGVGWMPWVVLTVVRGMDEGRGDMIPAIFAGAMQMLSGAPEVILLTWVFIGVIASLGSGLNFRTLLVRFIRFSLIVALVTGLAAIQLLPFLDLLADSQRDRNFSAAEWAMPIYGWANLLVPLFRSLPTELGGYYQANQHWVLSYYLGIGAVAFALLAMASVVNRRVCLLAGVTLACLILALGNAGLVYPVLRKLVPGLGFIRYPIKFIILPGLLIPLLAGFYVAHVLGVPSDAWPRHRKTLARGGLLLLLAVGGIAFAGWWFPVRGISWQVTASNAAVRGAFLAALLTGLAFLPVTRQFKPGLLLRVGLLFLLWLDIMLVGGIRPNPVVAMSAYEPGLIRREFGASAPEVGSSRALMRPQTLLNVNVVQFQTPLEHVLYNRLALYANANLLDAIPKVDGFFSLYIRDAEAVAHLLFTDPLPNGLLDLFAVSQINAPGKATEWVRRESQFPWLSSGQTPVFADPQATVEQMSKPDFDPRRTVLLPEGLRGHLAATNGITAMVHDSRISAQACSFQAECSEPALVVISQAYYKNWRATVDDKPMPLFRADYGFQAVEIPSGKHEVKLIYVDRGFRIGAGVSGLALAISLGIWLRYRRGRALYPAGSP